MAGSVYVRALGGGRWQLRTYHGVDPRGRPRVTSETFRGDECEARARAKEIEAAYLRGEVALSPDTLGGFLDEYLAKLERDGAVMLSTIRGYRHKRSLVGDGLARKPLSKVRARDLEARYAALADGEKPLAARTILHVHRFIFTALESAVRLGELRENPAMRAKPPTVRAQGRALDEFDDLDGSEEGEVAVVPRESVAAVLRSFRDDPRYPNPLMFAATLLAYKTGMRRGELCGLAWSAVDLERGEIDVRRSLYWPYKVEKPVIKKPKSGRARRIAISPDTVAALKKWRAEVGKLALAAGRPMPSAVFPNLDTFGPMRPDRMSGAYRDRARAQGLPTLKFHALRHTHASELLLAREPVHLVSRRLGHSDPGTTLRIYAHLMPGSDEEVAKRLDDIQPIALD